MSLSEKEDAPRLHIVMAQDASEPLYGGLPKTALLDVQRICVCVPTGLNTSWSWWFLGAIIDMPLYI